MLRAYLIVYPFLTLYIAVAAVIFVPLTWIISDIRPIYWVSRQGVRLALALSGVRVRVVDPQNATRYPTNLYISNHVSNLDPPALFLKLPRIAVILKKELSRLPLLGYVMKLGGFIYVDRKERNSRHRALNAGVETLRSGISLLIFPEGTRSLASEMLPFRPGPFTMAIEAGAPIVPITVHGARELMPKGTLGISPGEMTLVFHDPVETADLQPEDRADLMKRVRRVMEASLASV